MNHLLYNDLTNLVQTQNFASQSMQIIAIGANHFNRRKSFQSAQIIPSLQIFESSNPQIIKSLNLEPFER